jgi:hypothetical protein
MEYIVSECKDYFYVVQRPNGFGGLYPLVGPEDNCRSTAHALRAIYEDASNMEVDVIWGEGIQIDFRFYSDPRNTFRQGERI